MMQRKIRNFSVNVSQIRVIQVSFCLTFSFLLLAGCRPQGPQGEAVLNETQRPSGQTDQSAGMISRKSEAVDQKNRFDQAVELLESGDFDQALKLVQAKLVADPGNAEALELAMAIHGRSGDFLNAAAVARQLSAVDTEHAAEILLAAFDMHLQAAAFELAEEDLLLAEKANPKSGQVQRRLAQFLNAQGRRHEASEHVMNLIRLRMIQPDELLSLVDRRGPFFLVSFDQFAKPGQPTLFELGQIRFRYSATRSDREADLREIQQLANTFPRVAAVWAFYGRLLAELEKFEQMEDWSRKVPEGVQSQPEYWNAIGLWMVHQQRHREAIRAFTEALNLDPGDRESMRSIMSELLTTGEEKRATEIRQRLGDLDRFFRIAKEADDQDATWISTMLQEHGRVWESSAWYLYAAQVGNQLSRVIGELDQRHASITNWEQGAKTEAIQQAKLQKLLGFNTQDWPMPDLSTIQSVSKANLPDDYQQGLKLEDTAPERGLITSFVSDFPLDGRPMFPHQANGGGIAAFDYDRDGRCDLYFVQSGGTPTQLGTSQPNQLFREVDAGRYIDISEFSAADDRGFGQGVCAGDVNQDGFPDLLVANIGQNAIYLNQGDGTFLLAENWLPESNARVSSVSNSVASDRSNSNASLQGNWTSSLGLADLDGDQLPDLIEVNYINDDEVFNRSCTDNYLDCQPQAFRKCADVIYRVKNDGGFVVWQEGLLSEVTPKLGFGIVVANFDRKHGNDFFISNDGDLNHYWVSTPDPRTSESSAAESRDTGSDSRQDRFRLRESGTLLGCSIGRGGNSQACMGVSFGDFNRDGTIDLHVTNFLEEPVNLFMQSPNGTFIDEAMKYQLADLSRTVLGFGTQAVDFDNDGWLDLAILNGHVFDGRVDDLPFQMQPQLMRGSESGFVPQDANYSGKFWKQKAVGRTLALLDSNRDGRMDLVANHLDQPVALLENHSKSLRWIQVELIGTHAERDAVGAEVVVSANGEQWYGWQTGGDGLMASNEQLLHFGLANAEKVDTLVVRWPSGEKEVFADLSVDRRYLVVQGQPTPYAY
jgi:tetratricopeptide (TPR) repeat protein